MIYRLVMGSLLALVFVLVFTANVDWFSGFNTAQKIIFKPGGFRLQSAQTGIVVIYLMALSSVCLIVFSNEILKILGGIFLALVTFVVLYAFS